MGPAPTAPSEADILFNRTAVALARSQRLIASWLPPLLAPESTNTKPKTETEIEKEEREVFTPVPELCGIGAKAPADGEGRREEWSANERLGRQLLGRDYGRVMGKGKGGGGSGKGVGVVGMGRGNKLHPAPAKGEVDADSEDEGGRSSLGKSKNGKRKRLEGRGSDPVEDGVLEAEMSAAHGLGARSKSKKRASNYLDEVLADRSVKKRKKSRKKEGAVES